MKEAEQTLERGTARAEGSEKAEYRWKRNERVHLYTIVV